MSEVVGEAVVNIRTDSKGVDLNKEGAKAGDGYTKGFSSHIKGIGLAIGGAIVAGGALSFVKQSVAEARDSQKVGAATTQIIKATGGAAKISATQVGQLATAISNKAGVDDEAIQKGSNLLLTFAAVRNEVGKGNDIFNQATQAAVDLSAAGFGSITGASVQLGKALNDPIKGMSALGKSGVTFTADQQTLIKSLVASGHTLDAQKIILKAVQGQVGGVAAATATAGEKSAVAWGNVKESVGTLLLPALDAVENVFSQHIAPAIQSTIAGTGFLARVFHSVTGEVSALVTAFHGGTIIAAFGSTFSALGSVIHDSFGPGGTGVGSATAGLTGFIHLLLGQVVPALNKAGMFILNTVLPAFIHLAFPIAKQVGPAVQHLVALFQSEVVPLFRTQVLPLLATMHNTFVNLILPAIVGLVTYVAANLLPILGQVAQIIITQVVPTILTLAKFIYGSLYPAIVAIVVAVATQLKPVFDQLVATFRTSILPTIQKLIIQIRTQLIPALQPLVLHIVQVIGFLLKLAAAILRVVLPPVIRLIGFLLAHLIPAIVGVIVVAVRIVNSLIAVGLAIAHAIGWFVRINGAIITLVHDGIDKVVQAVVLLPLRILALGPRLLHAGQAIIGKFVSGLSHAGGAIGGIAGSIWDTLKGLLDGAIDKINSALEFKISIGFGKHVSINPPDIPHLASGTPNWRGGLTWVGEQGPELANLPAGTQVLPARQSAAAMAGVTQHFYGPIQPHNYRDFQRETIDLARRAALGGPRAMRGWSPT